MADRRGQCAKCGQPFTHPHKTGPIPQTGPCCRPTHNRKRQARAAAAVGDDETADALAKTESDIDPVVTEALRPALLAAALSLNANPDQAARIAGLGELEKPELRALVRSARKHYPGLIDGNASAIAAAGFATLSLALLRAVEGLSALPPASRASSAKAIVQTLEILATAAKPTFGDIEVSFEEVDP